MNLNLFMKLTKVHADTRTVEGIFTQEVPDGAGEIMDYESSKPNFEKWSQEFEKNTDGKSFGNVRAMHGKVAAGKLEKISFDDANQIISGVAKIVDDNEWEKVLAGVYTGFSVGGSYGKRWNDEKNPLLKRYTAVPNEVSLVDKPCVPTARFTLVKADGTTAEVEFKGENDEPEQKWVAKDGSLHDKRADALKKNLEVKVKNLTTAATEAANKLEKALDKKEGLTKAAHELVTLAKGLPDVARAALLINELDWLSGDLAAEALWEGDDSPNPSDLKAIIKTLCEFLKALVMEEVEELTGEAEAEKLDLAVLEPLAKFSELAKATYAKKKKKAEDGKMEGDGKECAAQGGDLEKLAAAQAETEVLRKALGDITPRLEKALERIEKLEAQPQAPKGTVRVISKSGDSASSGAAAELQKTLDHGTLSPEQARNALEKLMKKE